MSRVPVKVVECVPVVPLCPLSQCFQLASETHQKFRGCGDINTARSKAQSILANPTSSQVELEWATGILKKHPENVYSF